MACTPQTSAELLATHIATRLDPGSFRRHVDDPDCIVLLAEDGDGADRVGYTMLVTGEPTDTDVASAIRLRPTVEQVGKKRFHIGATWEDDNVCERAMQPTRCAATGGPYT